MPLVRHLVGHCGKLGAGLLVQFSRAFLRILSGFKYIPAWKKKKASTEAGKSVVQTLDSLNWKLLVDIKHALEPKLTQEASVIEASICIPTMAGNEAD